MLEAKIKQNLEKKKILLMTHIILGYPSFETNWEMLEAMKEADIELIEMQIPFSEPYADGPTLANANSQSLTNGTTLKDCFAFAKKAIKAFPSISFLWMTYYNVVFKYGEAKFIADSKKIGITGCIIPDLPIDEDTKLPEAAKKEGISNICIFTPTHTQERLLFLQDKLESFVYCMARTGITGTKSTFDHELQQRIQEYKQYTSLPLAIGFGIQSIEDVAFLIDKAEIAIIGSYLVHLYFERGVEGVKSFLLNLYTLRIVQ